MKDIFDDIIRTVDEDGNVVCRDRKGRRHREDGPAYEGRDGTREWWVHGKPHREDGPAYEGPDGTTGWYRNGAPWPEGQQAAEKKSADEAKRKQRDIDNCLYGLPYDLEVGKPLQLKQKKPVF